LGGVAAAPKDIPDDAEMGGAIDEPMVRFGGMVSDGEDAEEERVAIESRSGRKFSKVKLVCSV
jgi:hypothetical protein